MKIRRLEPADLPQMLELGRMMHAESSFKAIPYSEGRVLQLGGECLKEPDRYCCVVAVEDERLIGGMIGLRGLHFFSEVPYAADLALYVIPEKRGSSAAIKLLATFIGWAESVGCKEVRCGVTTGINPDVADRLYTTAGFNRAGALYVRRIGPLSQMH
jgi:GNAT superfamily N-acetyltransferase